MRTFIIASAICLIATSVQAGEVDSAVARFTQAVASGEDLAQSEFASALTAEDIGALKELAACPASDPRFSSEGSALVMWDCSAQPQGRSKGAMLTFEDGKLASIFLMSAVIVPAGN